jgi:hypothetical protein
MKTSSHTTNLKIRESLLRYIKRAEPCYESEKILPETMGNVRYKEGIAQIWWAKHFVGPDVCFECNDLVHLHGRYRSDHLAHLVDGAGGCTTW